MGLVVPGVDRLSRPFKAWALLVASNRGLLAGLSWVAPLGRRAGTCPGVLREAFSFSFFSRPPPLCGFEASRLFPPFPLRTDNESKATKPPSRKGEQPQKTKEGAKGEAGVVPRGRGGGVSLLVSWY